MRRRCFETAKTLRKKFSVLLPTEPSIQTTEQQTQLLLQAALKSCGVLKDLESGKKLHHQLISASAADDDLDNNNNSSNNNRYANKYLETALIAMYSKCGEMVEAQKIFDKMQKRDVVPWNALILGYVTNADFEVALNLYTRLSSASELSDCRPDSRTLVAALMAASGLAARDQGQRLDDDQGSTLVVKLDCLEIGLALHSEATTAGFDSDIFVSNTLIDLYGKCGSTVDARLVFDKMASHDVVSWTALILGNAENGEEELALQLLDCMKHSGGCDPNSRTFVAGLMACSALAMKEEKQKVDARVLKLRSLAKGMKLHCEAARLCYDRDIFVASTLVDMYAKCGSLEDAAKVFASMPSRDVVAWNALMLGYVVNGESESALEFFSHMKSEGCVPDARTYVAALMACSSLSLKEEAQQVESGRVLKMSCLQRGRSIHREAAKISCDSNVFVASGLVDVYAKCGSMLEAAEVFREMPRGTVAAWNSMMQGYISSGNSDLALQLFWCLLRNNDENFLQPDAQSFVAALVACSSLAENEQGTEQQQQQSVGKKLLKVKSLQKGIAVHAEVTKARCEDDLFVAATLVEMYARCGSLLNARKVFDSVESPNIVTWNSLLLGYAEDGQGELALKLYETMPCAANDRSFVAALIACGSLRDEEDREKWLRKIHSQAAESCCDSSNVFVANTLVDSYAKCGKVAEAKSVFDSIQKRSVVSWNAMLLGYVINGENELALELLSSMNISADVRTYVTALMACGNLVDLQRGKQLHAEVCRSGLEIQVFMGSSLVDFYGKCGSMISAQQTFDSCDLIKMNSEEEDSVPWNALLDGYGREGNSDRVMEVFRRMREEGVKLGAVTFLSVLSACSHAGMIEEGKEVFGSMFVEFGVRAEVEHYQCMIDLLGRANELDEAVAMARRMPYEATVVTWTTVLAACEKWGNLKMAKVAFEELMKVDDKHGPAYTLMANIFSQQTM